MLSSSKEYLQALREGKYLLFLDWPQFIAEKYKEHSDNQDADDTIHLLVFEWLNNGFNETDAKNIALLYAVHDLSVKPIEGVHSYAFTAILIALSQCMVYQSLNIQDEFISLVEMNKKTVNKFTQEINKSVGSRKF